MILSRITIYFLCFLLATLCISCFLYSSYASCIPFSFCRFLLLLVTRLGLLCIPACLRTSFSPLLGPGPQGRLPSPRPGRPSSPTHWEALLPRGKGCSPPLRGPYPSRAALEGDDDSSQRHALGVLPSLPAEESAPLHRGVCLPQRISSWGRCFPSPPRPGRSPIPPAGEFSPLLSGASQSPTSPCWRSQLNPEARR